MRIYLAAAIDKTTVKEDVFQEMAQLLSPHVCFNPKGAYGGITPDSTKEDLEFVISTNMSAIRNSDIIVARVDKVHSIGLPMELYYASIMQVPVVTWWNYEERPGIYLEYYGGTIVRTAEDLVNEVNSFLSKKAVTFPKTFLTTKRL